MLRDTGIVSSNYMWKEKANNYSGNASIIMNYIYMEQPTKYFLSMQH